MWTKSFKSSATAEDDVQEDDVEMTVEGGASQRYGKPQDLDQLEEWMKEKTIPYISNDKFSQEDIFEFCLFYCHSKSVWSNLIGHVT